jgi:hypothetical protein
VWQKLKDKPVGMRWNSFKNVCLVSFGIDAVIFARFNKAIEDGGCFAPLLTFHK